jgi:hypothetical protein
MAETVADEKPERGRPTAFDDAFIGQVEKLCTLGATDEEIAAFFGVTPRTIYRWKLERDEFCQAIKTGKAFADERVERSLYHKANGYNVVEQQAIKVKIEQYKEEVRVVDVEKHIPADTTAAIFWLKNRRKEAWRDKHEVSHTTEVTHRYDLNTLSLEELGELNRILARAAQGGAAGDGATVPAQLH